MSTLLNPALPTHDLRSGAQAWKRDKSHNAKWQHGAATKSGKVCPQSNGMLGCYCGQCLTKPVGPWNHNPRQVKAQKLYKKELRGETSTLVRKAFRNDVVDALDPASSSSSSDDDASSPSDAVAAAPLPAADTVAYSFDKPHGPSEGSDVLSNAVAAAVVRFENTQTEKLVSREYDVVERAVEDVDHPITDDDHDFELIEHAHLA